MKDLLRPCRCVPVSKSLLYTWCIRALWVLTIALGSAPAIPAQTNAPGAGRKDVLMVGAATDSFPRSYLGSNRRCEGFNVDLLDAVARVMDLKILRVSAPSAELEKRFRAGEFDLLQAFTPGPGRELYAEFSAPTLVLHGALFVRKDGRIRAVKDLTGSSVLIAGRGTVVDKLLADFKITPRTVGYCGSVEEALGMVNRGEYDATFASRLSGLSIIARDALQNVQALPEVLEGYEVKPCFAAQRGNRALIEKLNEGLAILHQTGEYAQIYERWFARHEHSRLTRQIVVTYLAPLLTGALLLTLFMLVRQRRLGQRLARQASQLAESEALLAEAQSIAHVGHWKYDLASRTLFCSAETYRILQRDPKSSITYRSLLAQVPRGERPLAHRTARETLHRGKRCELTVTLHPAPDVRKILQVKAQAVRTGAGKVVALFGTVQDITQQKGIEEDLRTREQLLRAIYNHMPSALAVVQPEGESYRFISANPGTASLLGIDPQAALAGKVLARLNIPKPALEFWHEWFRRGFEQPELLKAESSLNNGRKNISLTLVPLGVGANGVPQLCFLAEDITDRKQLDAEIAQGRRLRAVGELVGGIAHEFNNLLTPVLLKAELLRAEWKNEPRLIEELGTISRAAQRGADLTKRLLEFGRRSEAAPEEVKLHSIVRANIDLLAPTIDRRIRLNSAVSEQLPTLFLNASDLHQIVVNLLLNARDTLVEKLGKQQPDSFRAEISVEAAHFGQNAIEAAPGSGRAAPTGWVCLTVRDNGMGMSPEVQERIFEPFYTTKGVGKGTGLGLATIWHIVTRMGGKINVHSHIGEGTSFQVWLPVLPIPASLQSGKSPNSPESGKSGARICLIEDDELVAQTIAAMLRRQNHQIVLFRNGSEAWQHLSTSRIAYDVILLDLDLPGISGVEIVRRLRAHNTPGRILVASGRLSEADARQLEKLGADFQIEKPFTPQKLHLAVQTCLSKPVARKA
jgi:two-component system, cell cycle sensor histidine kinase and response regulator CckA